MIRVADLCFGPHGLSVLLPRSKADQEGEGVSVHVAANPLTAHCPVAALRAWLHAAGIRDGWVFRRISRSDAVGRHPLAAESVRLILKERAWEAGYRDAALARISPHSLRAGCITTLAQASVHERDIMRHSRHASQTVMRTISAPPPPRRRSPPGRSGGGRTRRQSGASASWGWWCREPDNPCRARMPSRIVPMPAAPGQASSGALLSNTDDSSSVGDSVRPVVAVSIMVIIRVVAIGVGNSNENGNNCMPPSPTVIPGVAG